ncbi:hypothetical protein QDR37_09380 [Amnibacterium sp. CER49]|uniref:hypothetical protein n=1 Tax=Amnibacterium sp. CER49 TaxID=3039161 RepID=UPI00244C2ABC|nr:hypothetical protein [Amnibacterium sp. CER49]MDH2444155.1 hypothetical protein [Amnibacterium sp. CER49]
MTEVPLSLDCRPGIDDALALAHRVAAGADLLGIGAVHGDVSAVPGARHRVVLETPDGFGDLLAERILALPR